MSLITAMKAYFYKKTKILAIDFSRVGADFT